MIDITRPPYNADPTGREDCTEILVRVMDDITGADRALMKRTIELISDSSKTVIRASDYSFRERQAMAAEDPEAVIGFERTHATFPYRNPPPKIIYFPREPTWSAIPSPTATTTW